MYALIFTTSANSYTVMLVESCKNAFAQTELLSRDIVEREEMLAKAISVMGSAVNHENYQTVREISIILYRNNIPARKLGYFPIKLPTDSNGSD